AIVTADRGHRIVRIVIKLIARGAGLVHRPIRAQTSVAPVTVGRASAGDIERREFGPRDRPILFVMPLVDAHVKYLDWRFAVDAVVYSFQVMIEPAQLAVELQAHVLRAEIHVTVFLRRAVSPGADNHLGFPPRLFVRALFAHADEAVDRALQEDVEPP